MSNFLLPHPPASIEQLRQAVIGWRAAAAHERFRIEHNLCCGSTATAAHNAALYDQTAADIERQIREPVGNAQGQLFEGASHAD